MSRTLGWLSVSTVVLGMCWMLAACGGGDDGPDGGYANQCGPVDENAAQEHTLLRSIGRDTTLKASCSPYYLPSPPAGAGGGTVVSAALTIEPGVEIIACDGGARCRLTVASGGKILANGTPDEPVWIHSSFDGDFPRGQWTGILFLEAEPGTVLRNVIVEQGGGPYAANADDDEFNKYEFPVKASIMIDTTRDITLDNVTIKNGREWAIAATTADGFEASDKNVFLSVAGITILNTEYGLWIPVDQGGTIGGDICFEERAEADGTCPGTTAPAGNYVYLHLDDMLGRNPEDVTRDATWQPLPVYHQLDSANVTNGATLTLADGLEIRMTGIGGITVGVNDVGGLMAVASSPGSIKIRHVEDNPIPTKHWDGISLWDKTDSENTHLENLDVGYGGGRTLDTNQAPADIQIFNSDPTVIGNHVHHSVGMGIHWSCSAQPPGLETPPLPSTNTADTATIACATATMSDGIAANFGCTCPGTGCQDRCQAP